MGFKGLVPADKLAATYNPKTRKLILVAEGEVQKYTYNIQFERLSWMGGLKFSLQGWTGPIGPGTAPYTHEQSFSITLPSKELPSGEVIIVTANYPKGKAVPIHWLGRLGAADEPAPTPLADEEPAPATPVSKDPTSQQNVITNETDMTVLFKLPFDITEAAEVPKFGKVNISFDPQYLTLVDAGIDDKNIVWTFNSLQTGDTQVIVTREGGIAPFHMTKTYDVRIIVLDAAARVDSSEILSFIGFVNTAVNLIKAKDPEAKLYEVQATLPPGIHIPATNPMALSLLKVIFRAGSKGGTWIIRSTGWGTWAQPQFIASSWGGDVIIPWPVKMDIVEAAMLMYKAGHTGPFWNCTLRHPLGPGGKPFDEPYYIFNMVNGTYVFVGVNDKVVTVNKAGQAVLPGSNEA
ncbi:hypothetical protein FN846DRAFT_950250 [Sphaerosporella brunnea]|uniref:Uncharacterized protein n=1 Tax=Sphaerosporella brunnea TaxID=1250544 RepID=A0A5J5EWJ1_9PEZI|nr:hypothetical protein FN846DRAFT_950250 [Sphaerosporella brunnea]